MAENLLIAEGGSRKEKYEVLLPQIEALVQGEPDLVANLANISSVVQMTFNFLWVGFYIVKGDELVLGPFQGPLACTRIQKGKGVCGACWEKKTTLVVDDVDAFPGHIACSSASRSEIVVPVLDSEGEVLIILDVDSENLSDFNETDKVYLERMAKIITEIC